MTPKKQSGSAHRDLTPTTGWVLVLLLALLTPAAAQTPSITLAPVVAGFSTPADIQHAGDGSGRLFLVQQNGVIRILRNGQLLPAPFLDITDRVTPGGGERGLLGLAFPPNFAARHYFYVDYTDRNGDTVVSRFLVRGINPDAADPGSEQVILTQRQPFPNHNGGQLQFGPDGFLYIAFGDGGSANDPQGNGQNRRTFLGKLLRIDVESGAAPYAIPPSNPFVKDPAYLPEIWALGLRNPWRFSFDRATGDLWIADVGQDRAEEVNFQPAAGPGGQNYGWNVVEGLQCRLAPGCAITAFTAPILEYVHGSGDCSVTGGYVYRGVQSPALRGAYLYADYCSGRIWGVRREGAAWTTRLLAATGQRITSFGQDEAGEIYIAASDTGLLSRITGGAAPALAAANVVNAASYAPGLVAGSAATAFVNGVRDAEGITAARALPLPEVLEQISVTVAGRPAPLYAVANVRGQEQVNFQVPFEAAGLAAAPVVVTRAGASGQAAAVSVLPAQPGIFTLDGRAAVAVHAAANTLVTDADPAAAGSFLYFYATGLGPVDNPPPTGAATPLAPLARALTTPSVTLGGKECEVPFAGLAPGLAGVYQVNIRVPDALPSGPAALVVSLAAAVSPPAFVPVR